MLLSSSFLVSYRNLVRILCSSLAGNRMCKVCAGRAWALSLTLDRLCEPCAARFLVQGSCSFAFVPSVSCAKLVRLPAAGDAQMTQGLG